MEATTFSVLFLVFSWFFFLFFLLGRRRAFERRKCLTRSTALYLFFLPKPTYSVRCRVLVGQIEKRNAETGCPTFGSRKKNTVCPFLFSPVAVQNMQTSAFYVIEHELCPLCLVQRSVVLCLRGAIGTASKGRVSRRFGQRRPVPKTLVHNPVCVSPFGFNHCRPRRRQL